MTIDASRPTQRLLRTVRFALLAVVSLAIAHDAIFSAQYGLGASLADAMRAGGHDGYWPVFSTIAVVAGTVIGLRAIVRFGRLLSRDRSERRPAAFGPRRTLERGYRRELMGLWAPLFGLVAVAFAIQENVEHLAGHGHLIGLGALGGPEYPLALPVIALVTLVAAALGAVVRWRIGVLEARLAGRLPLGERQGGLAARRAPARWAEVAAVRVHAGFLVRLDAGRAPPLHA